RRRLGERAGARGLRARLVRQDRPGLLPLRSFRRALTGCLPRRRPAREGIFKASARLDAADVRVAGTGVRGRVAPVALDLPALGPDRDEAAEGPRALGGVLAALAVVPRIQLRVGQPLAQLVSAHVRECREPLAVAQVR